MACIPINKISVAFGLLLLLPLSGIQAQTINEVSRREGAFLRNILGQEEVRYYSNAGEQDRLKYPFSPIEFFVGVSMWQDNGIINYSRPLPDGVLATTFEALQEARPFFLQLGSHYRPEGLLSYSWLLEYRRFSQSESLAAREGGVDYSIRKNYRYESYSHQLTAGLNWKNFTFNFGIYTRLLREELRGPEEFIFSSLDGLATVLPDRPSFAASGDEVRVFREPTTPYTTLDFLNVSFLWGVSYRLKINDNLFVELNTTNPYDLGFGFFFRLTGMPVEDNQYWQEHFSLRPSARQLEGRDYLSLRLGYNFNKRKRIKRKLGFD
ncbi:MAG: hypothetical protein KDD01_04025 [Phaeodactylibacter sp.]|nr:hypothetical protein [Phaeodactylibacter sp.]